MSYADEADKLRVKLEAQQAQHAELKARVRALSNESLDLDALDIAARKSLYVSDTNEMTIWLDP